MMKRILTILYTIVCLTAPNAVAQPAWVKKASKAVFTVKTFTVDDQLKASACGFFVGKQGEAVAPYEVFKGASRAVVIDADGKEWVVSEILGANETYDVAKFQVAVKKSQPLTIATTPAEAQSTVWLLPYHEQKSPKQGTLRKAEQFAIYHQYYTLALQMPEQSVGCPLLNDEGLVIGLMQQPAKEGDSLSYAVSASYADSLSISGLSINDRALKAIGIKKALPSTIEQCVLMLYMGASSLDSASYVSLVNEVIDKYPKAPDGYQYRAPLHLSAHNFDAAQRDMEQAISLSEKKDEAHFSFSRLILQKELYMKTYPYEPWSLDKAMDEAEKAYAVNAQPVYQQQQALILFAQKKYEEAAEKYLALTKTDLRSPELFYEASRCRELLNDTTAQLAMLDSAVAMFSRPLLKEAAPYLLARAQVRLNLKQYRDAVFDMNDYESLMRNQLNANFYYLRYQADMGGRLYQQALNDINRAIEIDEKEMFYRAEKASLLIRVGHFDEAAETARELIKLEPKQSDGYLFLGLALCLDNKKTEGLQQLQKALDMGDPQAAGFIEKYGK